MGPQNGPKVVNHVGNILPFSETVTEAATIFG